MTVCETGPMSALGCMEVGPSEAPQTLVFLHGGGGSAWHWQPVAERLTTRRPGAYRCLLPDLPGHGTSAHLRPFTLEGAAMALASLLAERGIERATMVGFSLGADVALELAALRPWLVEGIMVTGAVVRKVAGTRPMGIAVTIALPAMRWRRIAEWQAVAAGIPDERRDDWCHDAVGMDSRTVREVVAASLGAGWPTGLERFGGPVLAMAGEKEGSTAKGSVDQILGMLPNARGAVVKGASHPWLLADPDRATDVLEAWLDGAELPAGFDAITAERHAMPYHLGGSGHLYELLTSPLERRGFAARRRTLIAMARGRVAEIGPGMGPNLDLYRGPVDGGEVTHVDLLEPHEGRRVDLMNRAARAKVPMEVHTIGAEGPYPNPPYDTIVSTLVLCSIPDLAGALAAMREVLAPGGQLLFMEHEGSPGLRGHLQDVADPLWSRLSGGCHLNRDLMAAMRTGGWTPVESERFKFPLPVVLAKHCVTGVAVPTVRPVPPSPR